MLRPSSHLFASWMMQQWLDRASAQILAFVGRRLGEESIGLVFGARVPSPELAGLPELVIHGLTESDARSLLDSVLTAPVDAAVRDRIVAEAGGNPLALVELPHNLTAAELAGGFAPPHALPLSRSLEESFLRRAETVSPTTRRLMLLRLPSLRVIRSYCGRQPSTSGSLLQPHSRQLKRA